VSCSKVLTIALVKSLLVFVFSVEDTTCPSPSLSQQHLLESLSPMVTLDVISASISPSCTFSQIRKSVFETDGKISLTGHIFELEA